MTQFCYRRRCREKSASQSGHLVDQLLVEWSEVPGPTDESPDDGHLRPNADQPKFGGELAVVGGLQRRHEGNVRGHRFAGSSNDGARQGTCCHRA
jgi:hypothetical protein